MTGMRNVARLSLIWLVLIALFSIAGPLLTPFTPSQPVGKALAPPSSANPLGTDDLGRDLLSRMAYGGRLTLTASLAAVAITLLVGGAAGLIAGAIGGPLDRFILWLTNATLAIPGLLIALMLAAAFGPSPTTVVFAVGLGDAPGFLRTARAVFLQLRKSGFVAAAHALGASRLRIAGFHILPNAMSQLLPLATTHFAWALTGVTTLSFLGLVGDPSTPEWGAILNSGRAYLLEAPWLALSPGIAISLTILSVHFLGSWLTRRQSPFHR
ncbi:MAG: ABC transporter permease [Anaerolineales bacterium]|jgi:peptide/nickel transport system permease protein